ncbi:hypothetical protein Anapl_05298 [Anas platyrhynchos]|uniref:Uncharacterized protein n=1 Tax=Anas platyrhynchos TaxID=8839 RepID=R0M8Q2_ANAPL|nr:hypothetical protein Anapl_05298 [Anas platyrhynchos]
MVAAPAPLGDEAGERESPYQAALKYCHTSAKDRTLLTPKQLPKGIRAMTGIPWESHQEKEKGPLESHLSSVCTAPLHIYISCTKRGMYPDALSKFSGEKISSVKTVGLMKITSLALKDMSGKCHQNEWLFTSTPSLTPRTCCTGIHSGPHQ